MAQLAGPRTPCTEFAFRDPTVTLDQFVNPDARAYREASKRVDSRSTKGSDKHA